MADQDLVRMILVRAGADSWPVLGARRPAPFGLSFDRFQDVALNPSGTRAYVARSHKAVSVIDTATIPVVGDAWDLAFR